MPICLKSCLHFLIAWVGIFFLLQTWRKYHKTENTQSILKFFNVFLLHKHILKQYINQIPAIFPGILSKTLNLELYINFNRHKNIIFPLEVFYHLKLWKKIHSLWHIKLHSEQHFSYSLKLTKPSCKITIKILDPILFKNSEFVSKNFYKAFERCIGCFSCCEKNARQ